MLLEDGEFVIGVGHRQGEEWIGSGEKTESVEGRFVVDGLRKCAEGANDRFGAVELGARVRVIAAIEGVHDGSEDVRDDIGDAADGAVPAFFEGTQEEELIADKQALVGAAQTRIKGEVGAVSAAVLDPGDIWVRKDAGEDFRIEDALGALREVVQKEGDRAGVGKSEEPSGDGGVFSLGEVGGRHDEERAHLGFCGLLSAPNGFAEAGRGDPMDEGESAASRGNGAQEIALIHGGQTRPFAVGAGDHRAFASGSLERSEKPCQGESVWFSGEGGRDAGGIDAGSESEMRVHVDEGMLQ